MDFSIIDSIFQHFSHITETLKLFCKDQLVRLNVYNTYTTT